MSEPIPLSTAEVNQAVYVSIAAAQSEPELDILAGITTFILAEDPGLSTQQIRDSINELHNSIAVNRPDPQLDLSPNDSILTIRILSRVVPALTNPTLRHGAKLYTRAFLNTHRRGTDRHRQIAPLEVLFDRSGELDRFRLDTWQRLYKLANDDPAVADAVNQSPIGAAVGAKTTQDAATMKELVAFEPLEKFLTDHLQPDGKLVVTPEEIISAFENSSAALQRLRDLYEENLTKMNRAEQEARNGGSDNLTEKIDTIDKIQKELDKRYDEVRKGAKSSFSVLAFSVERFDGEFAGDIKEFASITTKLLENTKNAADAALGTAKAFKKILAASSSKLLMGGGIALAVALTAIAIQTLGLFNKPRTKTIEEVILEELERISKQITALRDELRVRFDRIDTRLNKIYSGILNRLAEIDFALGETSANVEEAQLALYILNSELQRLHRNVHSFLEAAHRRDFVEAVNSFLNFRELTGQDLPFNDFLKGENAFFSWGVSHAKDSLQAGPEDRSFQDDQLTAELTAFNLATNINYLRRWPAERVGLQPLSLNRLANPFDWVVACEAYAQLSEEWPSHAQQISEARVTDLIGIGETLSESLSRIADKNLFASLAQLYRDGFFQLKAAINSLENTFRFRPETKLAGIDLWGGAHQLPNTHFFLEEFHELRRCDGKPIDAVTPTVNGNIFGFDHSQLIPYMVASNLHGSPIPGVAESLDKLRACVNAQWETTQVEELGVGQLVRVRYRLVVAVEIHYGNPTVFVHRFTTDVPYVVTIKKDRLPTFDPATDSQHGKDPYPILVEPGNPLWNKLGTFPVTHQLLEPALLGAAIGSVQMKLKLLQRVFYSEVAQHFTQAGDPIEQAGNRLTGSKLLWQSFILAGLPLSTEANEVLRSLLFGNEALLAGSDLDTEDTSLDDFRDIYAHFATRHPDPPDTNILGDIEAFMNTRLEALTTTLAGIVDNIEASGQREPPELFAPTLLRLRLIHS